MVLGLCDSAEKIIANVGGRCDDAVDDVPCLKDPINCSGTVSEFTEATEGPGTYLITLRQNRYEYCNIRDNINAQPAICRTSATTQSFCIRNPFDPGCAVTTTGPRLGNDLAKYRRDRLAYCRGLNGAEANANPSNNGGGVGAAHTNNATNSINLCNVSDRTEDAAGIICGDRHETTTAVTAGLGLTRDPFIDFCSQLTEYDSVRLTRITDCAGFSDRSSTGTTVCNWAQQAALCSNNTANTTTNRLDAQCGTLNVPSKWATATTTITFTNSTGDANAFVENFDSAGATPVTFTENTLELHPDLPGRRVIDNILPNVRFYSARTAGVNAGAAVTTIGQTLILSTGLQVGGATQNDIDNNVPSTPAVDAGTARFFAGIEMSSGNVGRPVFNRADSNATWTGTIDWLGLGDAANLTGSRSGFRLLVNFNARTVQGAVPITSSQVTGNHLVIDGSYNAAGYISGRAYINDYGSGNPNDTVVPNIGNNAVNTSTDGLLNGLIGSHGAVGVFISNDADAANGFGGGFIVKPQ